MSRGISICSGLGVLLYLRTEVSAIRECAGCAIHQLRRPLGKHGSNMRSSEEQVRRQLSRGVGIELFADGLAPERGYIGGETAFERGDLVVECL
jgi:hypothetical protein